MKKLFLIPLLLLAAIPLFSAPKADEIGRNPSKNDRIAILGDSIPYAGGWPTLVTEFLHKNRAYAKADIVNFGLPSETINGLSDPGHAGGAFPRPWLFDRFPRIISEFQPTIALSCYGMNDGLTNPAISDTTFEAYQRGCRLLKKECDAVGTRVIFITPPLYHPFSKNKRQIEYDAVLQRFGDWLLSQQKNEKWEVIDIRAPLKKAVLKATNENPGFSYAGDGVHPGEFGHRAIAEAVCRGLVPILNLKRPDFTFPQGKEYAEANAKQAKLRDEWLNRAPHKRPQIAGYKKDIPVPVAEGAKVGNWQGYVRHDFKFENRNAFIILPKKTAGGSPWIWRTEFFGHEPQGDLALLGNGWAAAYIDMQNMYGAPKAIELMDRFYAFLTKTYHLSRRPVLEGFSRGGLYAFNWAARNPRCTAGVYGDAPVCDFKSWPGGKGKSAGSPGDWERLLKVYNMSATKAMAWKGNPVDNLAPLAAEKVPLFCVVRTDDRVVPVAENTDILESRYRELGGYIIVIRRPGDHHPHSLIDPARIVDFAQLAFNGTTPPTRIVCIGDSITIGASCPPDKRWTTVVQEKLGDKFALHNYGISGRTMLSKGNLPYDKTNQYPAAQSVHGDVYLIALGTNDSKPVNWDAHKKDFASDTKKMIETIRRDTPNAKIFLLTPIPADPPNNDIRGKVIAKEIVPLINKIAKEMDCDVIDTYTEMNKQLKRKKFTDLLPDGIHPNAEGHRLMGEFIVEELNRLGMKLEQPKSKRKKR